MGALIGVRVARKATRYAGAGFTSDALPTMRRGESGGLKKNNSAKRANLLAQIRKSVFGLGGRFARTSLRTLQWIKGESLKGWRLGWFAGLKLSTDCVSYPQAA